MATQTKGRRKKVDPTTDVLNVAFVWDMSGSMAMIEDATREGTSKYLNDLIDEERKLVKKNGEGVFTRLSLTVFDTEFEQWLIDEPIAKINPSQLVKRWEPRGWTALYDAIANTIVTLEASLKKQGREKEKILVVIMTDGGENSSKEYSLASGGRERLSKMVSRYEKKGNWTFVYLGAGMEAQVESLNMGISPGNVAFYTASAGSVATVSAGMSNVTRTLRRNSSAQSLTSFRDAGESQDYRDENDPTKS